MGGMCACECVHTYLRTSLIFPSFHSLLGPMEQFNRPVWTIVGAINLQLVTKNNNHTNKVTKPISHIQYTHHRTHTKTIRKIVCVIATHENNNNNDNCDEK